MPNPSPAPLHRVSILATEGVFASTLMQAKDFFHMASLRYGKQQGRGLTPTFEIHLVSPDGKPVRSFSDVLIPVDGALADADVIILPAFWDDFDALCSRYPQVLPWLREQHARGAVLCGEATGVFWLAEAGLLTGQVADPILGKQAKLDALLDITAQLGITPEDAIAVGDGANDLAMLTRAGAGVALHAKPSVQAECQVRVNHGDLTALLYLQGYRREEFLA